MQGGKLNLITAATEDPISLAEAKTHLRIDSSDDDTYITFLISFVTKSAEEYTGRAFVSQTWQLFLDEWPLGSKIPWWSGVREISQDAYNERGFIELPKPPLSSVTYVKTYDDSDTATVFSTDEYYSRAYAGPTAPSGRVVLRDGQTWPTFDRNADGIEIQFVCGYGDSSAVPDGIKQAIKEELSFRYENRGETNSGISSSSAKSLLNLYKIYSL